MAHYYDKWNQRATKTDIERRIKRKTASISFLKDKDAAMRSDLHLVSEHSKMTLEFDISENKRRLIKAQESLVKLTNCLEDLKKGKKVEMYDIMD